MVTPDTSTTPPKPKKHRQSMVAVVNLALLILIVLGVNYLSCSRYTRKDLSQDHRYTLSPQTLHFLDSKLLQNYDHPVKVIFAFRRNTENYPRMRALLEDYARLSHGKIDLECLDPIRSPNRAREIANIYGIEFTQNLVLIDARKDTQRTVSLSEDNIEDAAHIRILPSSAFFTYTRSADGKREKTVALQMEDVVTSGLIGAIEGIPRPLYLVVDKSRIGKENKNDDSSLYSSLDKIARQLNLQLIPTRISELKSVPENAAGLLLIGPQYDLEEGEVKVLRDYWTRPNAGLFVVLDPMSGSLNRLNTFLRENGLRPRADRIMKKKAGQALYEVNALFSPGSPPTEEFWNGATLVEGQSSSLRVDENDERLTNQGVTAFPLLEAGPDYYGETKFDKPSPAFNQGEDYEAPLVIAAAAERGNANDLDSAKKTSRLGVLTNMEMIMPKNTRPDQRDFIKSVLLWMTNREELAGIGPRNDLTVKIEWDEKAKSIIEILAVIILPLLSLLIGLIFWRSRRS